jgi:outer membrane protein OmpA-like peptidoglycan-associated protein
MKQSDTAITHQDKYSGKSGDGINLAGKTSFFKPIIQPKLTINQPNDIYEQEADAMADKVMRMSANHVHQQTFFSPSITAVQRKCQHCEEEEKKLHRKETNSNETIAGASTENYINSLNGKGRSLTSDERNFFEPRMDYDFSNVQLHTNSDANQSAKSINALAYTHSNHIVFGANQYQPSSESGQRLMAHELTHVVQQNSAGNKIQKTPDDEVDVLEIGQETKTIQRQEATEAPMSRQQEIALSQSSPGEVSATGSPVTISFYNFAINSATLKAHHIEVLRELARFMRSMVPGNFRVVIDGNTDNTGTPDVNNPLSVQRANAVRRFLMRAGVTNLTAMGEGEDLPIATNETVSGRTRNRRVDVSFVPISATPGGNVNPVPPGQDPTPQPDPQRNPQPEPQQPQPPIIDPPPHTTDDPWFCARYPLLCLLLPTGIGLLICILTGVCIPKPPIIPVLPPPPPPVDPDPKDKKPPSQHACVTNVSLPSGAVPILTVTDRIWAPFTMDISFSNDPALGCDCYCGEYQQLIRGYFDYYTPQRGWYRTRKSLTPGVLLDPTTFHEDGDGSAGSWYGHRFDLAGNLRPNRGNDSFLPNPFNGCDYHGTDAPGTGRSDSRDGFRFHLEFWGMPYDRCNPAMNLILASQGSHWTVDGQMLPYIPPTPPPAPAPQNPGNGPGPGGHGAGPQVLPTPITPRPTHAQPAGTHQSIYAGNISPLAHVGDHYTLRLVFRSGSGSNMYYFAIGVTVTAITDTDITVVTENNDTLNVAPEGDAPIILAPHKSITYSRALIERVDHLLSGH